jgi:hypothetical protein
MEEINTRSTYRVLSDAEKENVAAVKATGQAMLSAIGAFPGSREMSLAKTKVEEAVMWAVKGITG